MLGDYEVEAEAGSWPVAEWDRSELCGVFVDPGASNAETPRELSGIQEVWRPQVLIDGMGLVV